MRSSTRLSSHLPLFTICSRQVSHEENVPRAVLPITPPKTPAPESANNLLYHIIRTVVDYHLDPSGATRRVAVCGTYTTLHFAKAAARLQLATEGYAPEVFAQYEEQTAANSESWAHGDGVQVFARGASGEVVTVAIQTTRNTLGVFSVDGHVSGKLFYVLQQTTDYDADRSGGVQRTEVEGVYFDREEAVANARKTLCDEAGEVKKSSFVVYEDGVAEVSEYGEEAVVHAVRDGGENVLVSVVEAAA